MTRDPITQQADVGQRLVRLERPSIRTMARLRATAGITIATGLTTKVPFNVIEHSTGMTPSNAATAVELRVPAGRSGPYLVTFTWAWDTNTTGTRSINVTHSRFGVVAAASQPAVSELIQSCWTIVVCEPGDALAAYVLHSAGVNLTPRYVASAAPVLSAIHLPF